MICLSNLLRLIESMCKEKQSRRGHLYTKTSKRYCKVSMVLPIFLLLWICKQKAIFMEWKVTNSCRTKLIDYLAWRSCYYSPRLVLYTICYSILHYYTTCTSIQKMTNMSDDIPAEKNLNERKRERASASFKMPGYFSSIQVSFSSSKQE